MATQPVLTNDHQASRPYLRTVPPQPRTFTLDELPTFRGDMNVHMPFRVRYYGPGHWCHGEGQAHRFSSLADAEKAGRRWIAEGRIR